MTTLDFPMNREANLPNIDDDNFVVLGEAMRSVVHRVIEARSQFVEGLRCNFWHEVVESEFPDILDEDVVRAVTMDPSVVTIAAQYTSSAAMLKPTRLHEFED